MKLAKKMDKEYDEANGDASKYFTLLAVSLFILPGTFEPGTEDQAIL